MKIFGFSFDVVREPYVQFGSSDPVVAYFVDSTELVCKSPEMLPSTLQEGYWVLVRITDLVTYWSNSIQLFVETPPEVLALSPVSGPSFGGTTISILGRNFMPTFSLACLFSNDDGETRTLATWRSRDRVDCISPPWVIPNGAESVDVLVALLSGAKSRRETRQKSALSYRFATPITEANVAVPNSELYDISLEGVADRKKHILSMMALDDLDSIQSAVPQRDSPAVHTFKSKVVHSTSSSARYELLRVSGTTTSGREGEAHVFFSEVNHPFSRVDASSTHRISLMRGYKCWLDPNRTQESNSGYTKYKWFSSEPETMLKGIAKQWEKGVQRIVLSYNESLDDDLSAGDSAGEGMATLSVPLDTPGVLCTLPGKYPWVKSDVAAIIQDDFAHPLQRSISGITGFNRGFSCDSARHPFRCKANNYLNRKL